MNDYGLLLKMDEKISKMGNDIVTLDERVNRTGKDIVEIKNFLKDNNCKINSLENWKSKTIGMAISISLIIPVIIYLM